MIARVRAALRFAAVDGAVALGVTGRLWYALSTPVTFLLVAQCLTAEEQGYYYTFSSLLALQSFVELGLVVVIINVASHEWSRLELRTDGFIAGDAHALSRLVSLGRQMFRWYAGVSLIFMLAVGTAGFVFFRQAPPSGVNWEAPWIVLVLLSGLILLAVPFNALLEGCNQLATVQRFRLTQAIFATVALWVTLLLGGRLWGAVAWASAAVLRDLYLLLGQYRNFFRPFLAVPTDVALNWATEVWPMQWRLAISGMSAYLMFSLFNPVIFKYHGAVAAGQMGMTLQLAQGVQSMAQSWVSVNAPRFGMLIASRAFAELDRLWFRVTAASTAFVAAGALSLLGVVMLLHAAGSHFAARVLTPGPTALLLAAAVLMHISQCESAYLRAHKREPIMVLSVVTSLATGLLVWLLGRRFGPGGAGAAYASTITLALVWQTAIWQRFRTRWHGAVS